MPPPTPISTLTCKECGYNNEPERVYCHNCGAKLDRSVLPKEEQIRREPPEKARRRIMRMTNPGSNPVKDAILTAIKTIVYAVIVAAIVLMALEPDGVPPKKGNLSSRMVSSDLMELVRTPQPRSTTFTQAELNYFLGNVHTKAHGLIPGVTYSRTFCNLEPGLARITLERSFWGYPMYFSSYYHAEATNGVFIAANVGGAIGRLPVPTAAWKYLEPYLLKDIQETFKTEIGQLKQVGSLQIEKQKLTLVSKGQKQ
jgi:hypothetical protein